MPPNPASFLHLTSLFVFAYPVTDHRLILVRKGGCKLFIFKDHWHQFPFPPRRVADKIFFSFVTKYFSLLCILTTHWCESQTVCVLVSGRLYLFSCLFSSVVLIWKLLLPSQSKRVNCSQCVYVLIGTSFNGKLGEVVLKVKVEISSNEYCLEHKISSKSVSK